MSEWPDRLNRFVEALRTGRRPERRLGRRSDEVEDLRIAARLAGARPGAEEPDPTFLARLRDQIAREAAPGRRRLRRGALLRNVGLWAAGFASGLIVDLGARALRRPTVLLSNPAATPGPVFAASTAEAQQAALPSGRWIPVGPLDQFPEGVAQPVEAGAIPAFVVREGNQVRGLSRVCTHMGCLLNYDPGESDLVCPCHGASFDLHGKPEAYYRPALPSLPPVMVQVVGGTVYVLGT